MSAVTADGAVPKLDRHLVKPCVRLARWQPICRPSSALCIAVHVPVSMLLNINDQADCMVEMTDLSLLVCANERVKMAALQLHTCPGTSPQKHFTDAHATAANLIVCTPAQGVYGCMIMCKALTLPI
jgi:hypothetical protein